MSIMSPLTGKLFDKFGGRILAIIGLTIMAVTTYFFSQLELDTTYTHLMIIIFCAFGRYFDGHDASFDKWVKSITKTLIPTWNGHEQYFKSGSGCDWNSVISNDYDNAYSIAGKSAWCSSNAKNDGTTNSSRISRNAQQIMTQATLDGINYSFLVATFYRSCIRSCFLY